MFRVLVADTLPASLLEGFGAKGTLEIENRSGISMDELCEVISAYDGLVVRSRTQVTPALLQAATNLKVIGRAGAGVDNIDIPEATRRGVIVMNTPGGNTIAAAEHTVALLLSSLRNIAAANAAIRDSRWERKSYLGNELFSKTVGVVGLGKIGREVAKRLGAFQVKILGYDPILTREAANRIGVELVDFDTLLKQADIITVHVPRIPETINMLNAENMQQCKDGVLLVNCARGGIINEEDLLAALESGKIGMAALDVFEQEPPTSWALATHPKVVATPHLGASTEEAQAKVAQQILEQMAEYFSTNVATNAVNFVSVDEKMQPMIAPYFELASRLGLLYSRLRKERIQDVSMHFFGDVAEFPLEPIASHLMAGALKTYAEDGDEQSVDFINIVNSLALAREKGISIEISKKDHPLTSRTNLIHCDFVTESGRTQLAGTVYANDIYRLVGYNKFDVDAELGDQFVLITNDDVPGIIGKVGTMLGDAQINIGHVSSGRNLEEGTAVNIFNVEGNIGKELAQSISELDHVRSVEIVAL